MGTGCAALFQARLRPGVEVILDMGGFERHLGGADLVIQVKGASTRRVYIGK